MVRGSCQMRVRLDVATSTSGHDCMLLSHWIADTMTIAVYNASDRDE